MIYLDYSATTPVNEDVLDSFVKVNQKYIGNANSIHELGIKSKELMKKATVQVASLLAVNENEVIFTSGASEANNLAIFGVINNYKYREKVIITTKMEHSSVLEPIKHFESLGYSVYYVKVLKNGAIDLNDLKELMGKNPLLVSIGYVNSETGFCQNIKEISKIVRKCPKSIFHVDGTQVVGKVSFSIEDIDLFSFSGHKIYGLKGIGVLIKKNNIELTPLIYGGKSQTSYRSGTPALGLIVSLAKALRIALDHEKENYAKVLELNKILIKELNKINEVRINNSEISIPHIVNISILGIKPETMIHALEKDQIYISTKTACSNDKDLSLTLKEIGKSDEEASHSLRISLSHLTSVKDIYLFCDVLKKNIAYLKV